MNIHLSKFKTTKNTSRCKPRNILCAMLLVVATLLPSMAKGEEIFAELANQKQVESTYVAGKFSHNMKTWRSRSGEHALNLSTGFTSLYTYQCYSLESVKLARKILDNFLAKNKNVELMMRTREHGSEYMVYEQFNKDNNPTRMVIWDSAGPNVCEIVVVDWKDGLKRDNSYIEYNEFIPSVNGLIPIINEGINAGLSATFESLQDLDGLSQLKSLKDLDQLFNFQSVKIEEYE